MKEPLSTPRRRLVLVAMLASPLGACTMPE